MQTQGKDNGINRNGFDVPKIIAYETTIQVVHMREVLKAKSQIIHALAFDFQNE